MSDGNGFPPPGGPQGGKAKQRKRRSKPFLGLMSSALFMTGMKPPDYLIDGLFLRGCAYTICGLTGSGKTLLAILMAIKVARGEWFAGRKCRKGTVAFFAAENPTNVRWQYFSMCRDLGLDPDSLDISWHCGSFSIEEYLGRVRHVLST